MCVICTATTTFNPARHMDGTQNDTGWPGSPNTSSGPWGLDVTETGDASNGTSTTYSMTEGDFFYGSLTAGDSDWIAVTLEAGTTYTFAVVGVGALDDSVDDTLLRGRDSSGAELTVDDDGGPGRNSTATITASTTGTYYVDVSAYYATETGDYVLSMIEGSQANYNVMMGAGVLIRPDSSWASTPATSATVTWGIRTSSTSATDAQGNPVAFESLTAAQVAAAESIMELFGGVCGLNFTQVNPGGTTNNATMLFGGYSSSADGAGAYAYYPGSTNASDSAGDVWLNNNSVSSTDLPNGSYSHFAVMHEVGHAVGLAHPGDYNAAPGVDITYATHAQFMQDSHQFTIMSYFDESNTTVSVGSYPDTLLLYDLYALHQLYGANAGFHAGDSIYGFNSNLGGPYDFTTNTDPLLCIWDGEGYDTLDFSGYAQNQLIYLIEGMMSNVGGYEGNISIAIGAVIERAYGGSGDDTIEGNSVSNRIYGNDGNDILNGGAGHDTIKGGAHNDSLTGGTGADSLVGQEGNDTLMGDSSTDILRGDGGNDSMSGGTGNDTLYGGEGNDTMFGNTSLDTLYGGGGDDYISSGDGVDFVDGEAGNDTIYGRSGWDTLFGGAGDDSMYGSEGDDELNGGGDNDWLSGGSAWDTLFGNDGNDTLYGNFGSDLQSGGDGMDQLFGGTGDDTLRGGADNDTIQGNQGVDRIEGGTGDDLLRGGTQRDTFVFNTGHDNDEINDFEEGGDILLLSTTLTGGLTDGAAILARFADASSGQVVFDFGGGDIITLSNLTTLAGLDDNINVF